MRLRKPVRVLSASLMLISLTACATRGVATVDAACAVFKPITYAKADTDPTKRQIVSHNAAGGAACGWKAE